MDDSLYEVMGRVDGESRQAWNALKDYAWMRYSREDSGEIQVKRSLSRLAMIVLHHERTLYRWSSLYRWQDRVELFDKAMADWRVEQWQERRRNVDEQDYQDGARLRRAARVILDQVETKLLAGEDIGPAVAAKYIEAASKAQRLATGAPTEQTAVTLSDDVVAQIKKFGYVEPDSGSSENT